MLARLLIRRGSVFKAKLRIAKRLGKARAMTHLLKNIKLYLIIEYNSI
jgi:hypothetical protein